MAFIKLNTFFQENYDKLLGNTYQWFGFKAGYGYTVHHIYTIFTVYNKIKSRYAVSIPTLR